MKLKKSSLFLFLLIFLTLPDLVFASGIIPCGGSSDPCTLCHIIIGIKNLVDFGKNILVTAAIVAIFISGIIYIISTGNEKMIAQAKSFLTASLVGFAITLGAWLIVNVTIFWVANAKSDLDIGITNWYTFTCDTSSSALKGSSSSSSNTGIGSTEAAVGCGKVVDAAKQIMNRSGSNKCYYCNTFGGASERGMILDSDKSSGKRTSCSLNSCSGSPGTTDCQNFVKLAYGNASCSSPSSGNATTMYNAGNAVTDKSTLKAGDILGVSNGAHVVICVADGCSQVIHASGKKDDIKISNNTYSDARVLRASKFCTSCN